MLARTNRVIQPADFRLVLRRGRRFASRSVIVHVLDQGDDGPSRFGFIVTKTAGNAVTRNRIKRRLRAVSRELLVDAGAGKVIVIRALPGCHEVGWVTLHAEISGLIRKGVVT